MFRHPELRRTFAPHATSTSSTTGLRAAVRLHVEGDAPEPRGRPRSASQGIAGDGSRLFHSLRTAGANMQPYYTSPEDDGTKWTPLATPMMSRGAVTLAYDPDHHVMYSANTTSGLWRFVTR